jgi:hypothetical protein
MNHVDKLLANAGLTPTLSTGHQLSTRVMRIGPKEAAALLAANKDNRKLRPGRARYYAKVMKLGGWRLTHQGIAFCVDGRGLDLQHRLTAIIEAGVTVDMMVTEGLSAEAFDAIDQHERRSVADALRIDRSLADVTRMLIMARGGEGSSNPTILEVGEVSSAVEDLHVQLMAACNSRRAVFTSAPVRAAALVLMHERPALAPQVMQNYRIFALEHSEEWPRVMHAFNRQCRKGDISTAGYSGRMDLMARALVALDPARAHLSKIQIDAETITLVRGRATGFIGAADDATPKPEAAPSKRQARTAVLAEAR